MQIDCRTTPSPPPALSAWARRLAGANTFLLGGMRMSGLRQEGQAGRTGTAAWPLTAACCPCYAACVQLAHACIPGDARRCATQPPLAPPAQLPAASGQQHKLLDNHPPLRPLLLRRLAAAAAVRAASCALCAAAAAGRRPRHDQHGLWPIAAAGTEEVRAMRGCGPLWCRYRAARASSKRALPHHPTLTLHMPRPPARVPRAPRSLAPATPRKCCRPAAVDASK